MPCRRSLAVQARHTTARAGQPWAGRPGQGRAGGWSVEAGLLAKADSKSACGMIQAGGLLCATGANSTPV
jgi:hypothetical protein